MQISEAIDSMLTGSDVETVVERFQFNTGKPNPTLSFNPATKSRVVVADLDPHKTQCADTSDFKAALIIFSRDAKKFLNLRGWKPVGKPFFCDNAFVWRYENDPKKPNKFTPNRPEANTPMFSPEQRQRAAKIRKTMKIKPKSLSFVQKMLNTLG